MSKRQNYSPEFKAKVALYAVHEEMTAGGALQEIQRASQYDQRLEARGDCLHGASIRAEQTR